MIINLSDQADKNYMHNKQILEKFIISSFVESSSYTEKRQGRRKSNIIPSDYFNIMCSQNDGTDDQRKVTMVD